MPHIGRLSCVGIGKESPSGTAVTPTDWIPYESLTFNPRVEYVRDESAYGRIDQVYQANKIKEMGEVTIGGVIRDGFFGAIMMGAFGTAAAPALIEAGVRKHAFTVKNDNASPSYTLLLDDTVAEEQIAYGMVNSLEVEANINDLVRFNVNYLGQKNEVDTGNTPAFTAQDPFKACTIEIKLGDAIADLSGASALTTCKRVRITIEKNVVDRNILNSCEPTGLYNTSLLVTGELDFVYDATTYRDYFMNGTKKALGITFLSPTLIGATKYSEINFQVNQAAFETWDRTLSTNDLVEETVGFVGEYKIADSASVSGYIQNESSTQL